MSAYISVPAAVLRIPRIMDVAKRPAFFDRYQDGKLWYYIDWNTHIENDPRFPGADVHEHNVFQFPIPVEDAGGGAFEPEMKALSLMRWIRKHIDFLNEARAQEDGA